MPQSTLASANSEKKVLNLNAILANTAKIRGRNLDYVHRGAADTFGFKTGVVEIYNHELTKFGWLFDGQIPTVWFQDQMYKGYARAVEFGARFWENRYGESRAIFTKTMAKTN